MEKLEGLITSVSGGNYTVKTAQKTIFCRAKGAFRHEGEKPLAGDRVTVRGGNNEFVIDTILPRKNSFIRPPLANLDKLFIVAAAASPDPILLTLDKLASIAEHAGIDVVFVITKDDLSQESAQNLADIYGRAGFRVFVTPGGDGVAKIKNYLIEECRDSIIAFAGNSGVGKSTLLNRLFPALSLETGGVSRKTERGRHTTRKVELYSLAELTGDPGATGYAADTPGFSMLDFVRFNFYKKEDLPYAFREFAPYIGKCRYTKCTHTVEEGCAVLEAVNAGVIPASRHESFVSIYNDLKDKRDWDK